MTDPQVRDEVINLACTSHDPAACQDIPCGWCDGAAARADLIRKVFERWLHDNGHAVAASDLADAWDGLR